MIELTAQPSRLEWYFKSCAAIWALHADVDAQVGMLDVFVFVPRELTPEVRKLIGHPDRPVLSVNKTRVRPRIAIALPVDIGAPAREIGPLAPYLQQLEPFFRATTLAIAPEVRRASDSRGARACRDWLLAVAAGLESAANEADRPNFGEWWETRIWARHEDERLRLQAIQAKSPMAEDRFWIVVALFQAREPHARATLKEIADDELEAFQRRLEIVVMSLDTPVVDRAIYGDVGTAGDDFVYTRCGLVLRGRGAVERARVGTVAPELGPAEWLLDIAEREWERRHGCSPEWMDRPIL